MRVAITYSRLVETCMPAYTAGRPNGVALPDRSIHVGWDVK